MNPIPPPENSWHLWHLKYGSHYLNIEEVTELAYELSREAYLAGHRQGLSDAANARKGDDEPVPKRRRTDLG